MQFTGRQLFVYYRVNEAQLCAARCAIQAAQQSLRVSTAGLVAKLLERPDPAPDGRRTLMETYALPGRDVDTELQQRIEATMIEASWRWIDGERHVEVFIDSPCAS
ncbi:MAG TPA: DUF4936 family protein [Burkholderiaceae bacterium]|nr:DUF4936 family protein [Burkholderiaceae bacterium]